MDLDLSQGLPPGLVVSAPTSGAGKTTVTLGLIRALRQRGMGVQPFKCGPDYIDPAFHRVAANRQSFNLDSWSMPETMMMRLVQAARGAELVIAEGAMGLFDGVAKRGACGTGSSADISALMGWPVVLVIDCTAQAQTAAATALGLSKFREGVRVAGVILNKVSGERHFDLVRSGFEEAGIEVFGWLPRQSEIAVPERHLGLIQAEENAGLEAALDGAARLIAEHVDLDALLKAAAPTQLTAGKSASQHPPGQRIALARDEAFSFVYPHMLEDWRSAGAEILVFSPLADEAPDSSADVCWLPGGYPELHAGQIASASTFLGGLRAFARSNRVHGECGGYMVLGEALVDKDGNRHRMARLLGLVTTFENRKLHLGYRLAELVAPMPGFERGSRLRGHEFHYTAIVNQPDAPLATVADGAGREIAQTGSWRDTVSGTFFHLVAPAE